MRTATQKRAAAEAAVELIGDGMRVGLGSGSTAALFVEALGSQARERGWRLTCVATSEETARLARTAGLTLATLDDAAPLDLTVDGADEIGPRLALIKGGGGALLREKLVWAASNRCVVIADVGKRVDALGAFPLPVEVVAFAHATTATRLRAAVSEAGVQVAVELRMGGETPFLTDGGNVIYDVPCGRIDDAERLAAALKAVTGVVDHGLFLGMADAAIIGTEGGVVRLAR